MDNIKQKIVDAIKFAKEHEYSLVYGSWGNSTDKCACPMGCVLLQKGYELKDDDEPTDNICGAAELLGVSEGWVSNFISGFDNEIDPSISNKDSYKLGIEIRNQFNPQKTESDLP